MGRCGRLRWSACCRAGGCPPHGNYVWSMRRPQQRQPRESCRPEPREYEEGMIEATRTGLAAPGRLLPHTQLAVEPSLDWRPVGSHRSRFGLEECPCEFPDCKCELARHARNTFRHRLGHGPGTRLGDVFRIQSPADDPTRSDTEHL